jgi:carboxymethylenebutenolidase
VIDPVIEEEIDIRTADGTSDAVLYRPAPGAAARPGVIHLTDIGGIRASHRRMARRLAGQGYTVLMPNLFYRLGRSPVFDFGANREDPQVQARLTELRTHLTPEMVERDVASYVDFLAAHEAVARGPMGVVGYCLAGSMAMRTAAVRPERIAAAASFHGVWLFTDTPESPHLALPRIKARLYFGHAVKDRSMPEEAIAQLDRALASWGGTYESETYEGAFHAWTVPDSPVYNQPQAERAFEKLTALFADTLARARSHAR